MPTVDISETNTWQMEREFTKLCQFEDVQDNQISIVFFLHWLPMDRLAALYLSNFLKI